MAKKSRRPVRGVTPTTRPAATITPGADTTTPAPASASTSTSSGSTSTSSSTPASTGKASRRPRSRRVRQQTFYERYRQWIIGGAAVAGIVLIGLVFFQGANTKAYVCTTLLTPGPVESLTPRPSVLATPTPAPSATPAPTGSTAPGSPGASGSPAPSTDPGASAGPDSSASPGASPSAEPTPVPEPTNRLGFTTDILGRTHVQTGSAITYGFCPPTSGDHYNAQGRGPIAYQFYGPNEDKGPGGWIHNLEHGAVLMLYRCPSGTPGSGDCVTQAELDQMRTWFDNAPPNELAVSCPKKVLVARFDGLETKFAELAWGRALLTNDFDLDRANTFDQQWREHEAVPEASSC